MSIVNETIDLSAERYNRHETHDDVEYILSVIGEQPKRVLEVDCGFGRILLALADAGHEVVGISVEDSDLYNISATAKSLGINNVQWHKTDAVHDDWGSGFDVVVLAGNILFNIENIEASAALDEETGILRFIKFTERRSTNGGIIKEEATRIKHYAAIEHIHKWLSDARLAIEVGRR